MGQRVRQGCPVYRDGAKLYGVLVSTLTLGWVEGCWGESFGLSPKRPVSGAHPLLPAFFDMFEKNYALFRSRRFGQSLKFGCPLFLGEQKPLRADLKGLILFESDISC